MDHDGGADERVQVAIVGAGPVGLALALGLTRHGVQSILLEKNSSTSEYSKAPGIHVRTREVFQQWGVAERFLQAGVLRRAFDLHCVTNADRPLWSLDFSDLDGEADRPGLLILEQGETEKLLLQAVRETQGCDVRFAAKAVKLTQNPAGAMLTVQQGDEQRMIAAEFVVGCDGASSFVRDALGMPFDGITYSIRPMLSDVRIEDERDALPWPRINNRSSGMTAAIRLRDGLWRIIALESGRGKGDEVFEEEVAERAAEVLGPGPLDVVWASRFRIHRRASPRFRIHRVLLAGDAAHVHSPAGGQGMNAGIQDAHNLAWKLAAALQGGDERRLLDSYEIERRAVVVGSISRFTDRLTRAFLLAPAWVRTVAFALLRAAVRVPRLRRRILRRMAMINLDYRTSPLLDRRDRAAGMRLPNPLLTASDATKVRLYDLLPAAAVLLHVTQNFEHETYSTERSVSGIAVIRIGPCGYRDDAAILRRMLGGGDGWILVRPDAHVAWARTAQDGIGPAISRAIGTVAP